MSWNVTIASTAQKELKRIPWKDAERIIQGVGLMWEDPFWGDIQKLAGKDIWRRRVGSYRIFYKIFQDLKMVYIFEITRRTSKTY